MKRLNDLDIVRQLEKVELRGLPSLMEVAAIVDTKNVSVAASSGKSL